jgi:hypothetical protein
LYSDKIIIHDSEIPNRSLLHYNYRLTEDQLIVDNNVIKLQSQQLNAAIQTISETDSNDFNVEE